MNNCLLRLTKGKQKVELNTFLCSQRQEYPALRCPDPFKQRSWEQPHLLPWISYSPPFRLPTRPPLETIPGWDTVVHLRQDAVIGVLQSENKITDANALRNMRAWAHNSLEWLASEPVRMWYNQLHNGPKKSYCTLLDHIANECHQISGRDGCFISLNYAVRTFISAPDIDPGEY